MPGMPDREVNDSGREQAVDASRSTRERTLKVMRDLEEALAKATPTREVAWRKAVVEALKELAVAMRAKADELNNETSLLHDLLREEPRLENRIEQLRRQYDDLLRQIRSLLEEFSSERDAPDASDMRQRLAWLLTALRHFQSRETDLIFETIHVDIGAMD